MRFRARLLPAVALRRKLSMPYAISPASGISPTVIGDAHARDRLLKNRAPALTHHLATLIQRPSRTNDELPVHSLLIELIGRN